MRFSFTTKNENETIRLGEKIGCLLKPGDVIGLFGELGSGKTHMIKGICTALECANEVSSPSFTLINKYKGNFPVYHFDCYRINSETEIFDLGYEEYFYGKGICLIEWAERVTTFLPQEYIGISLKGIYEKGKENIREIDVFINGPSLERRSWEFLENYDEKRSPNKREKVIPQNCLIVF